MCIVYVYTILKRKQVILDVSDVIEDWLLKVADNNENQSLPG